MSDTIFNSVDSTQLGAQTIQAPNEQMAKALAWADLTDTSTLIAPAVNIEQIPTSPAAIGYTQELELGENVKNIGAELLEAGVKPDQGHDL